MKMTKTLESCQVDWMTMRVMPRKWVTRFRKTGFKSKLIRSKKQISKSCLNTQSWSSSWTTVRNEAIRIAIIFMRDWLRMDWSVNSNLCPLVISYGYSDSIVQLQLSQRAKGRKHQRRMQVRIFILITSLTSSSREKQQMTWQLLSWMEDMKSRSIDWRTVASTTSSIWLKEIPVSIAESPIMCSRKPKSTLKSSTTSTFSALTPSKKACVGLLRWQNKSSKKLIPWRIQLKILSPVSQLLSSNSNNYKLAAAKVLTWLSNRSSNVS